MTNVMVMIIEYGGVKNNMEEDKRKYYGQQCQDDDLNIAFKNLHHKLVDEVIGFCKAWNISIDEFNLSADGLEYSIKFGSWHPSTDSSFSFMKFSNTDIQLDEPFLQSI